MNEGDMKNTIASNQINEVLQDMWDNYPDGLNTPRPVTSFLGDATTANLFREFFAEAQRPHPFTNPIPQRKT